MQYQKKKEHASGHKGAEEPAAAATASARTGLRLQREMECLVP